MKNLFFFILKVKAVTFLAWTFTPFYWVGSKIKEDLKELADEPKSAEEMTKFKAWFLFNQAQK